MSIVSSGASLRGLGDEPGARQQPRVAHPMLAIPREIPGWNDDLPLPIPPSDGERVAYLRGRQQRWVLWAGAAAFLLVTAQARSPRRGRTTYFRPSRPGRHAVYDA